MPQPETTQHTPGPWEHVPASAHKHGMIRRAGHAHVLALVPFHTGAPSDAVDDANARLIAAAPDLLKACRLAVANEATADELRNSGMVDYVDIKALRAIAAAARAAIAKAEGR